MTRTGKRLGTLDIADVCPREVTAVETGAALHVAWIRVLTNMDDICGPVALPLVIVCREHADQLRAMLDVAFPVERK